MWNDRQYDRRMMAGDAGIPGGSPVATTQDYVNAYTGVSEPFDENNTMAPQVKEWYSTEALEKMNTWIGTYNRLIKEKQLKTTEEKKAYFADKPIGEMTALQLYFFKRG